MMAHLPTSFAFTFFALVGVASGARPGVSERAEPTAIAVGERGHFVSMEVEGIDKQETEEEQGEAPAANLAEAAEEEEDASGDDLLVSEEEATEEMGMPQSLTDLGNKQDASAENPAKTEEIGNKQDADAENPAKTKKIGNKQDASPENPAVAPETPADSAGAQAKKQARDNAMDTVKSFIVSARKLAEETIMREAKDNAMTVLKQAGLDETEATTAMAPLLDIKAPDTTGKAAEMPQKAQSKGDPAARMGILAPSAHLPVLVAAADSTAGASAHAARADAKRKDAAFALARAFN